MAWAIFLAAFYWALGVIGQIYKRIVRSYREIFIWLPMQRRGEEMVLRAKKYVKIYGPLAVRNKAKKGVLAVARYDKFDKRLLEIIRQATSARNSDPMCRRIFVDVVPTFTFAEHKGVQFLAHTGSMYDAQELMRDIVAKITSINKEDVQIKHYEEAVSILVVRDERLLIPFEFEEPLHTVDGELKKFGGTTLIQAEDEFSPVGIKNWDI